MSRLFSRATVSGATLTGANLKAALTALWDALGTAGLSDATRTTVSATSTLTTAQCGLLLVNAAGGNIVSTLPVAGTATDEAVYLVRRLDTSANTHTLTAGAGSTIEGQASITVPAGGMVGIQMPAGGTDWKIIGTSGTQPILATGGTLTAYTVTPPQPVTAYSRGLAFRVSFTVPSGTSPTLQASGIALPPNLVALQSDGTFSNITAGQIPAGHVSDVLLISATQAVVLTLPPGASAQIQPISASVAASALTLTASALSLDFRSATLTSGTITRVSGTPASLVVPSTATLGTVSAVQSRILVLALNNAGTIELAVVNIAGGNDLSETGLISTTAISAAATSASVVYSTTARTSVAYRVIGYIESTQATAGTWATAPSTIQGVGGQALTAMSSLGYGQKWTDVTGSRVTGTTYYNTTGRPIEVAVTGGTGSLNSGIQVVVAGLTIYTNQTNDGASGSTIGGTFIVPANNSYSVTAYGGFSSWFELR